MSHQALLINDQSTVVFQPGKLRFENDPGEQMSIEVRVHQHFVKKAVCLGSDVLCGLVNWDSRVT